MIKTKLVLSVFAVFVRLVRNGKFVAFNAFLVMDGRTTVPITVTS